MSRTPLPPDELEEVVEKRIEGASSRFGYLVGAAVNTVMLWVAHNLLDWDWPGFLTSEFDDVLPLITFSFVVSIVANLVYVLNDGWPVKPTGELTTAAIGFVVALRIWQVFPFEFTERDWSWLVRSVLVVAMVGSALGAVAALVKLARGAPRTGSALPRS